MTKFTEEEREQKRKEADEYIKKLEKAHRDRINAFESAILDGINGPSQESLVIARGIAFICDSINNISNYAGRSTSSAVINRRKQ